MNILFFIGNGFDINLGMATRYSDFYKYYGSTKSKSESIKNLKNHISTNIENWSDLEIAFGKYTKNIKSLNEFDELHEDIVENLATYLTEVEEQYFNEHIFADSELNTFLSNLAYPEQLLLKTDEEEISSFKGLYKSEPWNVDIITFNYTRTIERMMSEVNNNNNERIGLHHSSYPIKLKDIEHIHGYLDKRMILGVNDLLQIENTLFHQEPDILESIIKSECNSAQRHSIDKVCKEKISNASLICIFGSSLGDTDKIWWEFIGKQLLNDSRLIIFDRCQEINPRFDQRKARRARVIKENFLSKTNLSDREKEITLKKIIVGVNTYMFKLFETYG